MKKVTDEFYVLGGVYFTIGYIIDLMADFFNMCAEKTVNGLSSFLSLFENVFSALSGLFFAAFVVLLLRYLFTHKSVKWLQRLLQNFPKVSVYLYYIGMFGYVLIFIDVIVFALIMYTEMNEDIKYVLANALIACNIGGFAASLGVASYKVFYKCKAE
ncbi:MAG: hypothetical protein IJ532_06460 [Alphaproteobacteria bacterium]|nr:hypothetical protein [Alphaproteobacteria bacterium]